MKFKEALGIDISKEKIDVHLHLKNVENTFTNQPKGFKQMFSWLERQSSYSIDEVAICLEHTGLYSSLITKFFYEKGITFFIVPALEIKRSMGIARGKTDQIDAMRIAEYAYLRKEQLNPCPMPSRSIMKLRQLLSLRDRLVKQRSGFMATLKGNKQAFTKTENPAIFNIPKKMIHYISKQIDDIEKKIKSLIQSDAELKKLYSLISSIKGIGFILTSYILATTNGFQNFENSRKYACYCGVAPFQKQSGKSVKGKTGVSHLANKKMKSLFNIAACSAIQTDNELKQYFQRRTLMGKSKMSTLNIVRNKLIHRVFAVVKRGTPFVTLHKYAA